MFIRVQKKEARKMLRILFAAAILCFFLLQAPVIYAEDFVTKYEIIKRLGGVSATEKIPTVRTKSLRGTRGIDRSIKVVPKKTGVSEVPKHITIHLYFKINSTEFNDHQSHKQLAQLGLALSSEELRLIKVKIAGHTCDLGSDEYNLQLSQKRANRIMDDLITFYRIEPSRLMADGYGEIHPNVPNTTESNRKLNRRVVIERIE